MKFIPAKKHPYFKGMGSKRRGSEAGLHLDVVTYLKSQYPKVRFHTSLDGENLGRWRGQQVKDLQWGKGFPDLIIYYKSGEYCGLAIELKKSSPFKKDGGLRKSEHLDSQKEWLDYLDKNGFKSFFGYELDKIIKEIDYYLK